MREDGHFYVFLKQLLRRPQEISALTPSSEKLARAMAHEVPPGSGPVVELGPGTGKITEALLKQDIPAGDLHLIELNTDFVDHLRSRFPQTHVHAAAAQSLGNMGLNDLRAVVSGLPLLSFSTALQREILTAAFAALRPGGVFIQFTYGPQHPLAEEVLRELGLSVTRTARIWGNLPPARVYVYRRRPV
ncbi:class I SAM-dependent methyltransferase [Puniceibacterium sp. IMCC21224]|uniref:class I SAM-dependent methyltransferase n=1 Tax=Puniceibacterium sp. IMCC21224 TaxID=1618204 RepID=UPI00064DB198|nr:methyltransferase domain-containing protein [Puniceibacterium sp. IMCC21224]KMK67551.1 phospholipid N-methyltransferase [Puniceibacterium sp. IMCC21224]